MTDFEVEVFYDGACPLCLRETIMLRRRDHRARIRFTDIAADGFDAEAVGVTWEALMERIHGRLPDGTLLEGVEVFRRLYAAVGFVPLVKLSRAPGVSQLLDLAYHPFAKNRLRLTGRCADDGARCIAGQPTRRRSPSRRRPSFRPSPGGGGAHLTSTQGLPRAGVRGSGDEPGVTAFLAAALLIRGRKQTDVPKPPDPTQRCHRSTR